MTSVAFNEMGCFFILLLFPEKTANEMKKLFILLFIAVFCVNFSAQIQQINESFVSPFSPSSAGWFLQNNSVPLGPGTWAQGTGSVFPAYSGGQNDYASVNFSSQAPTTGDISNFFITPTITLVNGGVLEFYTRTTSNPSSFPDRLEIRYATGTGTGAIGAGTAAVGAFTSTLGVINPNLTSTGYPDTWTLYSYTLTGITGTVAGRFAFRYFVEDGGQNGTNSDYIGIDDVKYSIPGPCSPPTLSVNITNSVICGSGNATLIVSGGANYSWSISPTTPFNTTASGAGIIVSPTNAATSFTVSGYNTPGCLGTTTAMVNVVQIPNITAPNATACPGGTVLLTASGANTYSWSNGSTGSSAVISVTNSPSMQVAVIGFNAPNCQNTKLITVTSNTFLTVPSQSMTLCPDVATIIGASGATSYTWSTGANTQSVVITPTNNLVLSVTGSSAGCTESKNINITVDPNMFAPSFTTCAGTAATLVATGANSYSWSTGATSSMVVVSPTAATVYTVVGTSGSCSQTKTVSVKIGVNLSVATTQTCFGSNLLITAYGANSYTWQPINDFNSSVIVSPTAPTVYTVTGKTGTCTGSSTVMVAFCAGVEELLLGYEAVKVFPNPFNGELKIENARGDMKLVNIMGQIVYSATVEGSTVIDTESFDAGTYFLVITDALGGARKIIKVIKD